MKSSNPILLQQARVTFSAERIADLADALSRQVRGVAKFPRGARIAVGVGSRGIANLAVIVRAAIRTLKELGAESFIIPAMGSHGGATAGGQREVLASYGVTEAAMGCPVRSSMEVVELPSGGLEHPLFMDRYAAESDGIVLINRIKPHTDFHGPHESGLVKMAVIGLGKEPQADAIHRFGTRGLRDLIPLAARRMVATGKILFGIGIVENAYDETAVVEAIPVSQIFDRERTLLDIARRNMPRLPLDDLDVLIVDRIGKNISGCGMDTNIIGRIRIPGEVEPDAPRIKSIVVTDLTEETHGNAVGIGLADVTTRRLVAKIDPHSTYVNTATSGFLERGKIPLAAPTDAEAIQLALRGAGILDISRARIIRITDTLHLGNLLVSAAVAGALESRSDVELLGELHEATGPAGGLIPFPTPAQAG